MCLFPGVSGWFSYLPSLCGCVGIHLGVWGCSRRRCPIVSGLVLVVWVLVWGRVLGEAYWVLFRFLYGVQLADPSLIIHIDDVGWSAVSERFV